MSGDPRETWEEGSLERPVPPAPAGRDRQGGALRWALVLVAVGIFSGSVWYAYERGTEAASGGYEPPLIHADPRPTKIRPEDPGGLEVPNRDALIYGRLFGDLPPQEVERLLPPPEEPMQRPTLPTPAPEREVEVGRTEAVPPQLAEAAKPAPERPQTLTLKLDPQTEAPLLSAPTVASSETASPPAALATAPAEVRIAVAPMPGDKPAPPPAPAAARIAGGYGLQLVALRDEGGIDGEWRRLRAAFGGVLSGLEARTERVDLGQRGIFYRLIAGSFASDDAASAACDELRALRQGCIVVKLD